MTLQEFTKKVGLPDTLKAHSVLMLFKATMAFHRVNSDLMVSEAFHFVRVMIAHEERRALLTLIRLYDQVETYEKAIREIQNAKPLVTVDDETLGIALMNYEQVVGKE